MKASASGRTPDDVAVTCTPHISETLRRDKRSVAVPVAFERLLASSIDALVRSARMQESSARLIADRTLAHWLTARDAVLELRATGLFIAGRLGLQVSQKAGRWVQPAFITGLRSIRLCDRVSADQLLRFAEELAFLTPSEGSIRRFQDWLWQDGAEGFAIDLHPSFVEVMESFGTDGDGIHAMVSAVRGEAALASGEETVTIASSELDDAASREEFDVPLTLYTQQVDDRHLEMSGAEAKQLLASTDDGNAWGLAEIAIVLRCDEIAKAVPHGRFAQRLLARTRGDVDARTLGLLARLRNRNTPFTQAVADDLEASGFGASLAASVSLRDPTLWPLTAKLISTSGPTTASEMATGLLRRAASDAQSSAGVVSIVRLVGKRQYLNAIREPTLEHVSAVTMFELRREPWRLSPRPSRRLRPPPSNATAQLLNALFVLSRNVAAYGPRHPMALQTAESVSHCVEVAHPPFTLQLVGGGVFRDRSLVALDFEVFEQSSELGRMLLNLKAIELTFPTKPSSADVLVFGAALAEGTTGPSEALEAPHARHAVLARTRRDEVRQRVRRD